MGLGSALVRSAVRSARYTPAPSPRTPQDRPAIALRVRERPPDQAEIAAIFAELDEQVRQGY
jgi:hypothetical protein